MSSRLRLQYGALHIEYEGSDEFLKTELPALLEQIARLLPGLSTLGRPLHFQKQEPAEGQTQTDPQSQTYLGSVKF